MSSLLRLPRRSGLFLTAAILLAFGTGTSRAQFFNDSYEPPHNYLKREGTDAMSVLIRQAAEGAHSFGTETGLPLLEKLLHDLDVPVSSQVVLFSRTSLQKDLVSPENPRAIYFDDNIYLAWMPGGKIEVNSFDPDAGGLFYFEEPPEKPGDEVGFIRFARCMGCHGGSATNFLPGPLGRSHYTSETGRRLRGVPSHERTSHKVPFKERWGGYFVTGAPAGLEHMGNSFAIGSGRTVAINVTAHAVKENLEEFFDPTKLLRTDSDILPLMLFDHQIEGHALLVEARYRERITQYRAEQNEGKAPAWTLEETKEFFDKFVRYLLFADEVSLAGTPVAGSPDFKQDFLAKKRTDAEGHSLRDFDLESRLFRNRLSYLIYSDSFEGAPQSMKNRVYDRLWTILSAETPPEGYQYFEPGERQRILSILRTTKSDLPESWTAGTTAAAVAASP